MVAGLVPQLAWYERVVKSLCALYRLTHEIVIRSTWLTYLRPHVYALSLVHRVLALAGFVISALGIAYAVRGM